MSKSYKGKFNHRISNKGKFSFKIIKVAQVSKEKHRLEIEICLCKNAPKSSILSPEVINKGQMTLWYKTREKVLASDFR